MVAPDDLTPWHSATSPQASPKPGAARRTPSRGPPAGSAAPRSSGTARRTPNRRHRRHPTPEQLCNLWRPRLTGARRIRRGIRITPSRPTKRSGDQAQRPNQVRSVTDWVGRPMSRHEPRAMETGSTAPLTAPPAQIEPAADDAALGAALRRLATSPQLTHHLETPLPAEPRLRPDLREVLRRITLREKKQGARLRRAERPPVPTCTRSTP